MMISKIISGGQTGVDRAALDAAMALNIKHGGWCPKGRLAEDGIIPERYALTETSSNIYQQRTRMNVRDADATLIIIKNGIWGTGTNFTKNVCNELKKVFFLIDVDKVAEVDKIRLWLNSHNINILNVAGNRESTTPGIYDCAFNLLLEVCL